MGEFHRIQLMHGVATIKGVDDPRIEIAYNLGGWLVTLKYMMKTDGGLLAPIPAKLRKRRVGHGQLRSLKEWMLDKIVLRLESNLLKEVCKWAGHICSPLGRWRGTLMGSKFIENSSFIIKRKCTPIFILSIATLRLQRMKGNAS